MEQNAQTCRFILSCNYSSKIIEPIQSRCVVRFDRSRRSSQSMVSVAEGEGIKLDEDAPTRSFTSASEISGRR